MISLAMLNYQRVVDGLGTSTTASHGPQSPQEPPESSVGLGHLAQLNGFRMFQIDISEVWGVFHKEKKHRKNDFSRSRSTMENDPL